MMIRFNLTPEQARAMFDCLNEARKVDNVVIGRNAVGLMGLLEQATQEANQLDAQMKARMAAPAPHAPGAGTDTDWNAATADFAPDMSPRANGLPQ